MLVKLVGVKFRGEEAKKIVQGLAIGTSLSLIPEPTNPYDENAIKVCFERTEDGLIHIGYVAAEDAAELLLDEAITATVAMRNGPTHLMLEVADE